MTWHCNDCDLKFISEHSTACLQCGSIDTMPAEEKTKESLSGVHTEVDTREAIKDIFKELCSETYESPYMGVEWEEAINRAFRKVEPYFKGTPEK